MSKVYFKKVTSGHAADLSAAALEVFKVLVDDSGFEFEDSVPIKVHFGEKGNVTYVKPGSYKGIIGYLKENGVKSSFIETNVLYRGARTVASDHIKVALDHGFTDLPIIFADGERGEEYVEIPINLDYVKNAKIGKAFGEYNQFVVMSHFKGHGVAGFGGAMKQLAMGFAARGGKLEQHSTMIPIIDEDKCISCSVCVDACDVSAITVPDKALIDEGTCVGCAGCIAVCPVGAIGIDWGGKDFMEKLAEYAYAAQLGKENIYVTFLINITKDCDCYGVHMEPLHSDIGVFASTDPLAIDVACLDMFQKEKGESLFDSGRRSIEHAKKIGLGSTEYKLIEL